MSGRIPGAPEDEQPDTTPTDLSEDDGNRQDSPPRDDSSGQYTDELGGSPVEADDSDPRVNSGDPPDDNNDPDPNRDDSSGQFTDELGGSPTEADTSDPTVPSGNSRNTPEREKDTPNRNKSQPRTEPELQEQQPRQRPRDPDPLILVQAQNRESDRLQRVAAAAQERYNVDKVAVREAPSEGTFEVRVGQGENRFETTAQFVSPSVSEQIGGAGLERVDVNTTPGESRTAPIRVPEEASPGGDLADVEATIEQRLDNVQEFSIRETAPGSDTFVADITTADGETVTERFRTDVENAQFVAANRGEFGSEASSTTTIDAAPREVEAPNADTPAERVDVLRNRLRERFGGDAEFSIDGVEGGETFNVSVQDDGVTVNQTVTFGEANALSPPSPSDIPDSRQFSDELGGSPVEANRQRAGTRQGLERREDDLGQRARDLQREALQRNPTLSEEDVRVIPTREDGQRAITTELTPQGRERLEEVQQGREESLDSIPAYVEARREAARDRREAARDSLDNLPGLDSEQRTGSSPSTLSPTSSGNIPELAEAQADVERQRRLEENSVSEFVQNVEDSTGIDIPDGEVASPSQPGEGEQFGDFDLFRFPDDVPVVGGFTPEELAERFPGAVEEGVEQSITSFGVPVSPAVSGGRPSVTPSAQTVQDVGDLTGGAAALAALPFTAPKEAAEYVGAGVAATVEGEGAEFADRTGDAAAQRLVDTAETALDDPRSFALTTVGAGVASGVAIRGAQALGGARAARATSVAIQPGEELAKAAARRGVVSTRAASVVPGVRASQIGRADSGSTFGDTTRALTERAGSVRDRAPDVEFRRDADAPVLEISDDLRQSLREAVRPSTPDVGERVSRARERVAGDTQGAELSARAGASRASEAVRDAPSQVRQTAREATERVSGELRGTTEGGALTARAEAFNTRERLGDAVPDRDSLPGRESLPSRDDVTARAQSAALRGRVAAFNTRRRLGDLDVPNADDLTPSARAAARRAQREFSGALQGSILSARVAAFNARRTAQNFEVPRPSPGSVARQAREGLSAGALSARLEAEARAYNAVSSVRSTSVSVPEVPNPREFTIRVGGRSRRSSPDDPEPADLDFTESSETTDGFEFDDDRPDVGGDAGRIGGAGEFSSRSGNQRVRFDTPQDADASARRAGRDAGREADRTLGALERTQRLEAVDDFMRQEERRIGVSRREPTRTRRSPEATEPSVDVGTPERLDVGLDIGTETGLDSGGRLDTAFRPETGVENPETVDPVFEFSQDVPSAERPDTELRQERELAPEVPREPPESGVEFGGFDEDDPQRREDEFLTEIQANERRYQSGIADVDDVWDDLGFGGGF